MQYVITSVKGALALLLVCLMGAMGYLHFNKADFSRRVLKAINHELLTGIHIEKFRLDVFTHFPYITARLKDVSVEGLEESRLLDASEVQVLLHPGHMLQGELEVSRLYIEDGKIDVHTLSDRSLSLNIFKSPGEQSDKPGLVLDFRQVVLRNVAIHFQDESAGQEHALTFDKLRIKGRMGYQQLALALEGDFISHRVRVGDLTFLNACQGRIDGNLNLDLGRQLYRFDDLKLLLNGERFEVSGSIRGDRNYTFVDLQVDHPAGDLDRFLKILPPSIEDVITATGLSGRFGATGSVKGRMSQDENPYVQFDLNVPSGIVRVDSQMHIPVVIEGKFTNGGMRQMSSAELELHSIEGTWEEHAFSGMMRLIDMRDPAVQVLFRGALPASVVAPYVPGLEINSGTLYFEEIASARLWIDDLHFTDLRKIQATVRLEQIAFSLEGNPGHIANAGVRLDQGTLTIDSLDMKWQQTSGRISGAIGRLPEALQAGDAGLMTYHLDLDMDAIHFNDFLQQRNDDGQVRPVVIHSHAPLRLPSGQARIAADRFIMNRVAMSDLDAEVETQLHEADFTCAYQAMEGSVEGEGKLLIDMAGYTVDAQVACKDINIKQCFWQFQDFGQSTIRAEHLSGHLDAVVLAQLAWLPDGRVDRDAVQLQAGISISDGGLTGFEMLDKFSTYVNAEDLKKIKFERLDNYIEVRDGHVYLPVMFIQSNAVNLAVNGVHGFDNSILYNMKINAGQVLARKMHVHDPTLSPIPARKEGTFNLFYSIEGQIDDFRYRKSKRAVTSSFEQSRELRASIRDSLMQHFEDAQELIEPAEWESIPEYEEALMPEEFLDPIGGQDK